MVPFGQSVGRRIVWKARLVETVAVEVAADSASGSSEDCGYQDDNGRIVMLKNDARAQLDLNYPGGPQFDTAKTIGLIKGCNQSELPSFGW